MAFDKVILNGLVRVNYTALAHVEVRGADAAVFLVFLFEER